MSQYSQPWLHGSQPDPRNFGPDLPDLGALIEALKRLALPRPISLAAWAEEVSLAYEKRHPNTRGKMRQVLREIQELAPAGASTEALTPAVVDRFSARAGRASTTNGLLGSLRVAVRLGVERRYFGPELLGACRWRLVDRDPPRRRHHSREDIRTVLEYLESEARGWTGLRLYSLACVLAYCGLRPGEAYRLQVADVDLPRKFLFVRPHIGALKTPGSEAPVPMPDVLTPVLERWVPQCGSVWLFPRYDLQGPWVHGTYGSRPCERLRDEAAAVGVEGFTPRSLRHSLATHLAGWWKLSGKQIQLILRHTTERTQGYYVHPDLENLRDAVAGFHYRPPLRNE